MSLGIVMLVHSALDRAEQVIRHWYAAGCPLVVHVDAAVPEADYRAFAGSLADLRDRLVFAPRFRCEWGSWELVAATQAAAALMLDRFEEADRVFLASGSCLPLRPVAELRAYLEAHPETNFIESATVRDVTWTRGGLGEERFTLRFPFSWKRQRRLFDAHVALQRRLGVRRRMPAGLVPHMGSQWWCLTRQTLQRILNDPDRAAIDRYFRQVWIPDESYFQTMARRWSDRIESRSLTASTFDFLGRPHILYDDHLPLLRRSGCFVARKAWPGAERLYEAFLQADSAPAEPLRLPDPGRIERVFARAAEQRLRGRAGLIMQGRLPAPHLNLPLTAAPYSVFEGVAEVFDGFAPWLARQLAEAGQGAAVHGHLFAPERAEFAGGATGYAGGLSDSATLRDYHAQMFLSNLIWNTRGQRQCFSFGPRDTQAIHWDLAKDPNAVISVISGAWMIPLHRAPMPFARRRAEAARLQRIEAEHLAALRSPWARARVRIWTLAEALEAPEERLQEAIEDTLGGPAPRRALPALADMEGLPDFLQALRNAGMHPQLTGELRAVPAPPARRAERA
ncbi:beta-1,6-N-acetylglucosaminyltransferase [Pseudoroseicyclus aestuarii]|uniref:Peptide O-xylosyltransferase n=1 Tax=Pseudoroseicyclus aestuarii TaxID=1795041 RepID=A0A318T2H0_9RHOB|nr:beta-1,6-N-acetylglucosaminyltransferase [Pseudoroseicyclus aestuarii]PYE84414.1 core-2/I-Branching enzyme [Pseudoroseicyclus aestuarii]